jgi:hypothetical protein
LSHLREVINVQQKVQDHFALSAATTAVAAA